MFSVDNFQAAFDAALAKCQLLDRAQAKHFVDNGYVVVKAAFSERIASAVRAQAWQELKEKHDVEAQDPRTWGQRLHGRNGIPGYVRTAGSGRRFLLHREAPKAFQALADAIGGAQRLPANGTELAWGDGVVANLGVGENDDRIDKETPTAKLRVNRSLESARQPSWHKTVGTFATFSIRRSRASWWFRCIRTFVRIAAAPVSPPIPSPRSLVCWRTIRRDCTPTACKGLAT